VKLPEAVLGGQPVRIDEQPVADVDRPAVADVDAVRADPADGVRVERLELLVVEAVGVADESLGVEPVAAARTDYDRVGRLRAVGELDVHLVSVAGRRRLLGRPLVRRYGHRWLPETTIPRVADGTRVPRVERCLPPTGRTTVVGKCCPSTGGRSVRSVAFIPPTEFCFHLDIPGL
jgi:hypothetical protein